MPFKRLAGHFARKVGRWGARAGSRFLKKATRPIWKKIAQVIGPKTKRTFGAVARAVSSIQSRFHPEVKWLDTNVAANPDNAAGLVIPLTFMAVGTTENTRTGNQISGSSIDVRFLNLISAAAATTSLRTMIILDKQNARGVAPVVGDILEDLITISLMDKANSDRFVVLRSDVQTLTLASETRQTYSSYHIGLKNLLTKFDGAGAAQGDAAENHIYLVLLSSEIANTPTVTGRVRFNYFDN